MPQKGVIPPQFLKHPPKSWSKDMKQIRADARNDERKASRGNKRGEKRTSDRGRKKRSERKVHILPDLLAAGAVATPFVYPLPNGDSVLNSILSKDAYGGYGGAIEHAMGVVINNPGYYAKPMVVLGAGALALKWFSRKLGLNRVGTKEFKIG